MTGWPSPEDRPRAGADRCVAVVGVLGAGPAAAAQPPVPSTPLFTFQGDDVFESSGLVDRGDVVYTNNDSGDDAVVYGVDSRTGRVVSRTTYADSATDVEAIAPGSGTGRCGPATPATTARTATTCRSTGAAAARRRPTRGPATTWPTPTAPTTRRRCWSSRARSGSSWSPSPPSAAPCTPRPATSARRHQPAAPVRPGRRPGHRRHVLPRRQARAAADLRHRDGLHLPRLRAHRDGHAAAAAAGRGDLGGGERPGAGQLRGDARPGAPGAAARPAHLTAGAREHQRPEPSTTPPSEGSGTTPVRPRSTGDWVGIGAVARRDRRSWSCLVVRSVPTTWSTQAVSASTSDGLDRREHRHPQLVAAELAVGLHVDDPVGRAAPWPPPRRRRRRRSRWCRSPASARRGRRRTARCTAVFSAQA